MQRSGTFRFTPARLVMFLMIPALFLGATFLAATGNALVGALVLFGSAARRRR